MFAPVTRADRVTVEHMAILETVGDGDGLRHQHQAGEREGPGGVNTLAPYALNSRVKDSIIRRVSSQMGFVVTGCAAGRGGLNVPWLLERLRAAGRDVNAILELWTPCGPTLDVTMAQGQVWAEASIRYQRQFIPH